MHLYYGDCDLSTRNGAIYLYKSRKTGTFIGLFAKRVTIENAAYGGEVNTECGVFDVLGYKLYVISTEKEDYFVVVRDGIVVNSGNFTKVARYIIDNA